MANAASSTNGYRPSTPTKSGAMSLTEYTANPSPPATPSRTAASKSLPPEFLLPDGHPDYVRLIHNTNVYEVVKTTPLTPAVNLSRRYECNIMLKREDLQPVFSFKLRGAYNKMASLTPEQRWKGVVACSAGNHAQGVAYSARQLKVQARIVMPKGTPAIKYLNVQRLGGDVMLYGDDFDEAKAKCHELEKAGGLTNIAPFDDPYVIAGQGTIGLELMTQTSLRKLEAVFCCVGGGGLIAGIGVFLKRVAPHVKIIGVEHDRANAMVESLKANKRVFLKEVGLFADGAAVKGVGEETFRICKDVIDEVIEVTTDETCAAIKEFYGETRSIVEPAGALALAGLKKYVVKHPSRNRDAGLVALMSGANMNFDTLRFVADRAALGENKEALLSVVIPEEAGSFAKLIDIVLPRAVTEFSYRYNQGKPANILMGITVDAQSREAELKGLIEQLRRNGMKAIDATGDEEAKGLVRHFGGGRSSVPDERLYMFEFPERPGALAKFLKVLRPGQNITLFSYRSTGGDVSRLWAGIQCPDHQKAELEDFLETLGYPFHDRTDSETYKAYLRE